VLSIDGSAWVPSAIYVDDDGTLSVGRDAERKARLAPERFEPNPKRRVDDGEILLGVRVVPVVDAIAAVLRRVGEEARRQLNGRAPDEIHLTHPAQWGASRQNILLAAARAAGLGTDRITLIPEPVAAAAHFASLPGKALPPGTSLAVYDLGGGTFDCAVVGATPNGYSVLAESGLADVGGVDFDQAIVDHLGRTVSAEDPARWQAYSRPRTAADRRAARSIREDVRAAKETLSRYAQTDLPLPDPFEDTLLTRKEFDGLIRPVLTRTVEVLADTVRRSGLTPDRLAGVYLVGGSSRIPLIASLISDRLGIVATTLDQPETSVAMGAALIPGGPRPSHQTSVVGPPVSGPVAPVAPVGRSGQPGQQGMIPATAQPGSAPAGPPTAAAMRPMVGAPAGPPPGYRPPAAQNQPAPSPSGGGRRALAVGLAVAAVLVVAATVTAIVLSTKGGDSADRTTPPVTTSAGASSGATTGGSSASGSTTGSAAPVACTADDKDKTTGMTSCLRTFTGQASDNGVCTADVSDQQEMQKVIDQLKPTAFSFCQFNKDGKVINGIFIQTASTDVSEALYDQERRGIGGTSEPFEAAGHSGSMATGAVVGTGEAEVVWTFDGVPVLLVLTPSTSENKEKVGLEVLTGLRTDRLLPSGG
jgi:actin-like ATPase involved in cell morphogenesis